jgi:tRNA pseudouridine55 synthase
VSSLASPTIEPYRQPDVPVSFDGVALLMDKPKGWSSFDVIRALRRLLDVKKIGHAGTLDPMATGLLIVLVGRKATKQMQHFMDLPKTYEGTLRLGEITPSYDAETEVTERHSWEHITEAKLDQVIEQFTGTITQRPPMYSAVKVDGERLYKKARRGETVERPPRVVTIDAFTWTERDGAEVSFRVECSKGTYIRSLAHDIGQQLGCGAHLVALRRTAIGPYQVDHAWTPAALEEALAETE